MLVEMNQSEAMLLVKAAFRVLQVYGQTGRLLSAKEAKALEVVMDRINELAREERGKQA